LTLLTKLKFQKVVRKCLFDFLTSIIIDVLATSDNNNNSMVARLPPTSIGSTSEDASQLQSLGAPELARKVVILRRMLKDREGELQELNEQAMAAQYKRLKRRLAEREKREGQSSRGVRVARVLPHFAMAAVAYGASMVVPVEEVLEVVLSAAAASVPS
jgi:hypothetical protein